MQNLQMVDKNSDRISWHLWTKVHKILGQCDRFFVIWSAI